MTADNLHAVIATDLHHDERTRLARQHLATTLRKLGHVLLELDDQRQHLRAAGDTEGLLEGLAFLRELRKQLSVLERSTEDDCAALLAAWPRTGRARRWTVDGIGLVEVSNQYPPRKWDDHAVVPALVRAALDPEGTGEVPADLTVMEVAQRVARALTDCASLAWRTGTTATVRGLASYGLDPNAYREEAGDPRATVKITPATEPTTTTKDAQ